MLVVPLDSQSAEVVLVPDGVAFVDRHPGPSLRCAGVSAIGDPATVEADVHFLCPLLARPELELARVDAVVADFHEVAHHHSSSLIASGPEQLCDMPAGNPATGETHLRFLSVL